MCRIQFYMFTIHTVAGAFSFVLLLLIQDICLLVLQAMWVSTPQVRDGQNINNELLNPATCILHRMSHFKINHSRAVWRVLLIAVICLFEFVIPFQ